MMLRQHGDSLLSGVKRIYTRRNPTGLAQPAIGFFCLYLNGQVIALKYNTFN